MPQTFATFENLKSSKTGVRQEFCAEKAKEVGYTCFSMDDKGCHGSQTAEQNYDKFGESEDCVLNKNGFGVGKAKTGSMFVYKQA